MVRERPLHRKNGILLATMIRQGYTLRSLAKAAGVHYLTIWRIVNREHRPTQATAAKLAALLDCPPERLGLQAWGPPPAPPPPEAPAAPPPAPPPS